MEPIFVKARFDIDCNWQGIPPIYRVYVNEELFTERTWIWTDHFLREFLQISALPGQYRVRLESVRPNLAKFRLTNFAVEHGPARWIEGQILEINHARQ